MSVTFGFYNSRNYDRVYDAVQLSSIFDGIINDGIIQNYGGAFQVTRGTGMWVNVATGRAWFDHTWTLNDASLPLQVSIASAQPRIDSVILEVNLGTRTNSVYILRGTPASSPVAPALTNNSSIKQYRLANIQIAAGATEIGTVTDFRGQSGGAPWASSIITDASEKVNRSGDTMTGALTLQMLKGTSGVTYGPTLPAAGNAGRIFFKTVT